MDRRGLLAFCALVVLAGGISARAQQGSGTTAGRRAADDPIGTWRGESKCVVRPSGCRDEESVYRVSAIEHAADRVRLSGNKMVAGKEVNMGEGECSYQAKAHALECPLPNGNAVHLEVHGDAMEGTMTLRDGTLWRKISLHRAES